MYVYEIPQPSPIIPLIAIAAGGCILIFLGLFFLYVFSPRTFRGLMNSRVDLSFLRSKPPCQCDECKIARGEIPRTLTSEQKKAEEERLRPIREAEARSQAIETAIAQHKSAVAAAQRLDEGMRQEVIGEAEIRLREKLKNLL